jgi:hypothetical protein
MQKLKYLLTSLSIVACLTSCGKKGNGDTPTPETTISIPDKVGSSYNKRVRLWKNGIKTPLIDLSGNASGNSVFVSGNDVYVAGFDDKVAKLWKNGVATNLTNGSGASAANSVYVSGGDVYVAGYENISGIDVAKIWKNGSPISLSEGAWGARANSVCLVNNDVYAVGYSSLVTGSSGTRVATVWKNGVAKILSNTGYEAVSVQSSGSDIYILGLDFSQSDNVVRLWKNEVMLPINDSYKNASINSIFLSGNDIYAVGRQFKRINNNNIYFGTLWKNNDITYPGEDEGDNLTNAVYVVNSNVYVVGQGYTGTKTTVTGNYTVNEFGVFYAKIWKNGIATALTDKTKQSAANSVFVAGNDVYVTGWESDK